MHVMMAKDRTGRRSMRLAGWLLLGGVALGALVGACKPRKSGTPPLCSFKAATDAEIESQTLPPEAWLPIVSPNIDRSSMIRRGPAQDACGRGLEAGPAVFEGCPPDSARVVTRPEDPVDFDDLVLGQVAEGRMLAWAAVDDLSDGDAIGPAALLFWTTEGLDVHATGMVRGLAKNARLRLHQSSGKPVMIIDSQRCGGGEGSKCVPEVSFVPIIARKFRDLPLYDDEGTCLGRTRFELERRVDQPTEGGFTRRFELQRTVELAEEGVVLVDLVTGVEFDPADTAATSRPFRKVSTRRALELDGERFIVRDKDLFAQVLRDYGLVSDDGDTALERSDPDGGEEGLLEVEGKAPEDLKQSKSKKR
jgi:hypothetical protein